MDSLPNDVVYSMVSLLSAKEAACTRSVSMNMKNLITILPDLVFACHKSKHFKLFATRVLGRHVSHRVRRVSLELQSKHVYKHRELLTEFVRNMLNRGVLILELTLNLDLLLYGYYGSPRDYSLPCEVFTCKTVVELKLGFSLVIKDLPDNASLPALKTLVLNGVWFDSSVGGGCLFTRLISASPLLEDLQIYRFILEQWKWSRVISSLTLKRLTIERDCDGVSDDWSDLETISFETPCLTYLDYSDVFVHYYPVVNLDSLVEAKINLDPCWDDNFDPTNLIKGFKNVQFLNFDRRHALEVFLDFSEAVPLFENLSHLKVPTDEEDCWDDVKVVLNKAPNLKTLIIEDLHFESGEDVCECLLGYSILGSIEVFKITSCGGSIEEMSHIKHILQNLPCLELLEVHFYRRMSDEEKLQITRELLRLPRASSKCKIEVTF